MKKLNALLVFLISSLAITGISFLDGKIWDIIFIIIGLIAYTIVGFLFSVGILSSKKQGKDVYALVFFLLLLAGYGVYKILEALRNWILSWPLAAKIAVLSSIGLLVIVCIVLMIICAIKNKAKSKKEKRNNEEK